MECIRCHREIPEGSLFCLYCGKRQGADPAAKPRKAPRRARGTGSVYKLPGRRKRPWTAVRGGQYIGFYSTKSDALVALERVAGLELGAAYNYTLEQVYECWRAEHFPTLTEKGQEMYRLAWKRMEQIKGRKMREIRTADYQCIINAMEDAELSASSAQKVKQLAGQLSKWSMREDIITTNYAQFIRIYADEPAVREIFSDEEIALLKANDANDAVKVILLLIYTGLRIGELFSLRRENVHLKERYLVGGSKTKAGKNRTVPILPEALPYLQYFWSMGEGDLLISGYQGNRTANNFRKRDFAQALASLGITGKTPHSTRHTFASLAVRAGVKPEALRSIIGHANYSTTVEIYAHANLPELQAELAKISGLSHKPDEGV